LELFLESRLGEQAAWEEVAPVVDVGVKRIELFEVGIMDRAKSDGFSFEHFAILTQNHLLFSASL
jgi:hypothetical protein